MGTKQIQLTGGSPANSGNQSWPNSGIARLPNEAAILQSLAPLHWWNANHVVQSGGLVDSLVDIGTSPKNFTQVGAARAPLFTDAAGQVSLSLDGVADYYQAGVPADWTFGSNGTGCTFALIGLRDTLSATAFGEAIFGTVSGDTTKNGFDLFWGFVSAVDQGPLFVTTGSTLNTYVLYTETAILGLGVVWTVVVRTFGRTPPARIANGVTNNPIGCQMQCFSQTRATCIRNLAYNTGAPTFALTLGRRADLGAGQFFKGKVYDVMIHNDAYSDAEVNLWLQYARIRQGLAPQTGWPFSLVTTP